MKDDLLQESCVFFVCERFRHRECSAEHDPNNLSLYTSREFFTSIIIRSLSKTNYSSSIFCFFIIKDYKLVDIQGNLFQEVSPGG